MMQVPNINIPNLPIPFSIVALLHFFFTSNALLIKDFDAWIPSYLFTHVILIIIALWAAQDQKNLESILAYIVAVAITILNDMILLGIYFSDSQEIADEQENKYRDTWRYSAAMVIIHLIIKPLCILFALFAAFMRYRNRGEVERTNYENIGNHQ